MTVESGSSTASGVTGVAAPHGENCATGGRAHLMTIALEDYFQVGAFNRLIDTQQWYRFESRLDRNTDRTLELLDRHDVKATFFTLGWNAEHAPKLIRRIADCGHELASGGYLHRSISEMSRDEFRDDLVRSRQAIEDAAGQSVIGYRMPSGWLRPSELWMLDVLAEQGYAYDSSLFPLGRRFGHEPHRRHIHEHATAGGAIVEYPPATARMAGVGIPIAGGNYLRQFPHSVMKRVVARRSRQCDSPLVMYFHVWELDEDQPAITAAGTLQRLRHYRRLGRYRWMLADYFEQYRFESIADHMWRGYPDVVAAAAARRGTALHTSCTSTDSGDDKVAETSSAVSLPHPSLGHCLPRMGGEGLENGSVSSGTHREPVTIVIPCCNEERSLPYLAKTLESVEHHLTPKYSPTFLFVDDGSVDATWDTLHAIFDNKTNCRFERHEQNQGVSAAIVTGIRAAETDIVCSIDCDCSYDPHELARMIPLLTPDVDLVTASPYHPDGEVRNVPEWRLGLSTCASALYRRVLGSTLHTFTSCFRVYRRSAVLQLDLRHGNYLGIAELLSRMLLNGSQVVEFPTTLAVRIFGQSKMKTLRTIRGHLWLLRSLQREQRQPQHPVTHSTGPICERPVASIEPVTELSNEVVTS